MRSQLYVSGHQTYCYDEKIIFEDILKMSTTKNLKKKCCYKHWKNITKTINGKECSAFERLTITCTFEELIDEYVRDVLTMRQHIFHLEWQRLQFGDLIENLKAGEVIMPKTTHTSLQRSHKVHIGIICSQQCTQS